ncbi:transient-receptor-potential-like protein [Amphiura filiformis]|uniref:transient-receptor-potential-like protein n=1 Tax=Amphiura filiformis TaxID=82378 RepID=UPI003B218421
MESRYLTAVKSGDTDLVEKILSTNVPLGLNIDATDESGRSPLTISIEDGNTEMLKLLLKHEVDFGDALLHAVNVEFVEGVRILCETAILAKEFGTDNVNKFACESNFPPSSTPLMLAGERNNPEIIQILLQNGAKMPALDYVISQCQDTFSASLARISWYKAIHVTLICY